MPSTEITLHINSSLDRRTLDTTTHDWVTYLNKPLSINPGQKMSLSVSNIEIPNSAYTFPPTESTLWYLDAYTNNPAQYDGGVTKNIVKYINLGIDQVYDAASLVTALNAGMVANSNSNLVFSYVAAKGKLLLTNTTNVSAYLVPSYRYGSKVGDTVVSSVTYPDSGPTVPAANNCIDRLGFSQKRLWVLPAASNSPLLAEGLIRLNRTNCYFLTCESISSKIKQSQNPSPYVTANVIAKMPAGQFGTMSVIRGSIEPFEFEIQEKVIESFKFGILDDQLITIDLNHCVVTFELKITIA
jgi:hypothetical protein